MHFMHSPKLEEARAFAVKMHGPQRYGAHPYVHHLDAVVAILEPFGLEAQTIGYLHDVVEDTEATVADVQSLFGEEVAQCVTLLTDEPGIDRKERKTKTYAKLAGVSGVLEVALVVKAADRLANVRACVADGNIGLWSVYQSEQVVFKISAFRLGLCGAIWSELELLLSSENRPLSV
ncbi:MAG: hypothetical protein JWP29_4641 [Rhodoferax sp.]|nr:hypothetical protein [Rhodoferax sp.]